MASPGSVVIQFKAVATQAARDVATFATSLGKVEAEADSADRALSDLDTAIDDVGDAARTTKGDVDRLGDELALVDFDQVAVEAERTADRLRLAASEMARHVDTGARDIDTTTDRMATDMGDAGKEAGAEFVGNIAEGIGSGQANLNDIVSGTLGGITNLAATLAGPVGVAAGAAAAGVGLVFAAVKGQSEAAKARVDDLIGALEEVGTTSGKAARTAIWDTWLTKMRENRGALEGIVTNLKIAGIDQKTFRDAITGSAADQEKVRTQLFLTGKELIQNKQHGEELTEEQEAYLENFPRILQELDTMNGDLGDAESYFDDIEWLSDKAGDHLSDWKGDIKGAQTQLGLLDADLDRLESERRSLNLDVHLKDKDGRPFRADKVMPFSVAPPPGSAAPSAGTMATTINVQTAAPPQTAVMVTEEQVYRAIERIIMRGQARNGRRVVVG